MWRARRQARQPVGVQPDGRRGRLRGARHPHYGNTGSRRTLPGGSGHRLLLCADVPSVDETRCARPARARRPDGVQPFGAADEPGRRQPSARRRLASGVYGVVGALAGAPRHQARVGRARRRWHRRADHDGLHQSVGVPGRNREHLLRPSDRCRPAEGAAERAGRRRCAHEREDPRVHPRRSARPGARRRVAQCRSSAVRRGRGGVGRERHCDGVAGDRSRGCETHAREARVGVDRRGIRLRGWSMTVTADLLETIVAATRRIVEVRQQREPRAELEARASARTPRPGIFAAALGRGDRINVIAECKRRSPSKGVLRADYDPVAIATGYAAAGAAAISVLTEPTFFDGALEHLKAVRDAVDVPILRKDFVVSEYQLLEARANGADAVLLIVAALRPVELKVLHDHAVQVGLDVLVEVHNTTELMIAADAGARIVGVNNRNLRTLEVDVKASDELIAAMPPEVIAVSESGLKAAADLTRLRGLGYQAFLIGERFMTDANPGEALGELVLACS